MARRKCENKSFEKQKFTIVLTNYNNEEYIEEALVSIFNQTYNNIELIITDDASKNFNKIKIERIIKKYSPKNIIETKYVINDENVGTVKTLNKALKLITGEYVLFFASDDVIASKDVLQNFVDVFKDKKINAITSNWIICDKELKPIRKFVKPCFLKKIEKKNVKYQYKQLCKTNIYGAGSTCYRKSIFDKYGNFDESFKYLEDWPLWIKLTLNNEKIHYSNFDGLLHRGGGISNDKESNNVKILFFKEILNVYRNIIFKNFDSLDNKYKIISINSYIFSIIFYSKYFDTKNYYDELIDIINSNKKVKFHLFLYECSPKFIKKIKDFIFINFSVPIAFFITIISSLIIIYLYNFNNHNLLLFFIISLYTIIYYITSVAISIIFSRRSK